MDQINELTALVDPGPSMSGTRADELNAVLLSAVKAVTAYERAIYDDGALVRD